MSDAQALAAGRIEDKWIEFVVAELSARPRVAARTGGRDRFARSVPHVAVRASYLWLFAAALLTWLVR